MAKKSNVVKFNRPTHFNIGILLVAFFFVYLFVHFFNYITEKEVAWYEVQAGTLSSDTNYRAFILREESVIYSGDSGYLDYYFAEGDRVSTRSLICTVDEDGSTSANLKASAHETEGFDSESYELTNVAVSAFLPNYDGVSFNDAYVLADEVDTTLTTAYNHKAYSQLTALNASMLSTPTFHKYYPAIVGDVSYTVDGYENVNIDNFNASIFDTGYKANKLFKRSTISAGEPIYKLVTSEDWKLIIEIDEATAQALKEQQVVKVHFHTDDGNAWAYCDSIEREGKYYGILSLYSAMVRYISDRYLNIELEITEENGLKIPTSSIVKKQFYIIPEDYFGRGNNSTSDMTLIVEKKDDKNNILLDVVSPTIYHKDDSGYYIDLNSLDESCILIKPQSNERYIPSMIGTLNGVYNINKGYATFKMIDVMYQNENYTVVRTGTDYGLAMYDHILLDGSTAKENEIIYR